MVKYWGIVLKILVSGGLLAYFLDGMEISAILEPGIPAIIFLFGVGIFFVQILTVWYRWYLIKRQIGLVIDYRSSLEFSLIGHFFNQILPASVGGDAIRVWKCHRYGLSTSLSFFSVAFDRIMGMVGIVLLVSTMELFLVGSKAFDAIWWVAPVLGIGSAVGIFALIFIIPAILRPVSSSRRELSGSRPTDEKNDEIPEGYTVLAPRKRFLTETLLELSRTTRQIFLNPRMSIHAASLSLLAHLYSCIAAYILAPSFGIRIGIIETMIIVPLVILISALPISIAGWGVREGTMVVGLGLLGIAPEPAVLLSITMGVLIFISALPGGVVWILSRRQADKRR